MSRRSQRVLCAPVLLLQVGGCRTWETAQSTSAVPSTGTSIPRARLVLRDGSPPLALSNVNVRSDSMTGYLIEQGRSRMAFPRADVVAIETRVLSQNRTLAGGVLGGIAAFFLVYLMAYALAFADPSPES